MLSATIVTAEARGWRRVASRSRLLTNSGYLLSDLQWDDPRATDGCLSREHTWMVACDLANDRGIAPPLVFAHPRENGISDARVDDGNHLAFVGDINRVHAQQVASCDG